MNENTLLEIVKDCRERLRRGVEIDEGESECAYLNRYRVWERGIKGMLAMCYSELGVGPQVTLYESGEGRITKFAGSKLGQKYRKRTHGRWGQLTREDYIESLAIKGSPKNSGPH